MTWMTAGRLAALPRPNDWLVCGVRALKECDHCRLGLFDALNRWSDLVRSVAACVDRGKVQAGWIIVSVHRFIAVASSYIAPFSPGDIDGKHRLASPSLEHPFGADSFGRNRFTRTRLEGRAAMGEALLAAANVVLWGRLLGVLLAFTGGRAKIFRGGSGCKA